MRRAITENSDLHKQVDDYFKERVRNIAAELLANATVSDGIKVVKLKGVRVPEMVKGVAFAVRTASPENTVFIAATADMAGKPLLTMMVTDDVTKSRGLNASQIVREAAKKIKGGGGGQPGFAQAGGKNADGLLEAFDAMEAAVNN